MCFLRENKGFTLVEIMVAIIIGLVLIASVSATYVAQERSFVTQESVSEINSQSKIAQDLIANDLKSAGFGIPANMNLDPVNGYTTSVAPVDNNSADQPDAVTIISGTRMIGTLWPSVGGAVTCPASVPMGTTVVRIVYSGTDGPNVTDKRYLNIDGIQYVQVQSCALSDGTCLSMPITLDRPLTQDYPLLDTGGSADCDVGRPVYLVEDTTFCVDANATLRRIRRGANPNNCTAITTSDNDAIAQNIEDLQLAYAIDNNNDGRIDDLNVDGNINALDFVDGNNAAIVANPAIIRAIRINVLAMADRPDMNYRGLGNPPSTIENRNHTPTNDDLRRRWWQSVVSIRNQ